MTNPHVELGEHGAAFAHNIRTARKLQDLTLEEVVARCNKRGHPINKDQLIRIEAGQRRATVDDACEIARALSVKLIRLAVPSQVQIVPNRPLSGVFADDKPTRDILKAV